MRYFSDCLVLCCLFDSGFFFGYYCKYAYVYDNLFTHWFALVGVAVALLFASLCTLKKKKQRRYTYDHFWLIFYGLVCQVIASCFMLSDNLDVAFYFGFIGLAATTIPAYSFLSLRSTSDGARPARIGLGNFVYFTGLTVGFVLFNEFAPQLSGWILLGVTVTAVVGCLLNETLQHLGCYNYKESRDAVFQMLNEDRLIFEPSKAIFELFAARSDFYLVSNRQWCAVLAGFVLLLERLTFYSPSVWQLAWSATIAQLETQYLYGPFMLYTCGCGFGCAILMRYKAKLIYLLFGLIKVTATAAFLGVYAENRPEDCFYFLCFYYVAMGVYSSVAFQMLLECAPFLHTELLLTVAFALEVGGIEGLKYETKADDTWLMMLGITIASLVLTVLGIALTQLLLPSPCGLVEMRNKLLGIRRHRPIVPQTKIWNAYHVMHHDLPPEALRTVTLPGNRTFLQYPAECSSGSSGSDKGKTKF